MNQLLLSFSLAGLGELSWAFSPSTDYYPKMTTLGFLFFVLRAGFLSHHLSRHHSLMENLSLWLPQLDTRKWVPITCLMA